MPRLTREELERRHAEKIAKIELADKIREVRDVDVAALRTALTSHDVPTAIDLCARIAKTLGAL